MRVRSQFHCTSPLKNKNNLGHGVSNACHELRLCISAGVTSPLNIPTCCTEPAPHAVSSSPTITRTRARMGFSTRPWTCSAVHAHAALQHNSLACRCAPRTLHHQQAEEAASQKVLAICHQQQSKQHHAEQHEDAVAFCAGATRPRPCSCGYGQPS